METDGALSSIAQKRELHGKSSCNGMEKGKGPHVIQFWKTWKETMCCYGLVYGKAMPDDIV